MISLFQDTLYYSHQGDNTDLDFFYITPNTGDITLRRPLTESTRSTFTFTVRVVDDRPTSVQKSDQASVEITVLRDSAPPRFVSTPYITSVPINQAVNSTVYTVRAVDSDLKVKSLLSFYSEVLYCIYYLGKFFKAIKTVY